MIIKDKEKDRADGDPDKQQTKRTAQNNLDAYL